MKHNAWHALVPICSEQNPIELGGADFKSVRTGLKLYLDFADIHSFISFLFSVNALHIKPQTKMLLVHI